MTKLTALNLAATSDAGAPLTLLHPVERVPLTDEKGKPVTINLLGKDSDAWIKGENAARNRSVEHLTSGAKFSAAASDQQGAEALARVTTGWSGVPQGWIDNTDDETPAKFSYENALAVYSNRGVRWVREQADQFVGSRGNFLKTSPGA